MKMIIMIVKDSDADTLTQSLTSAEYRVTRVASTGGFLRSGFVTLLLGVDDDRAARAFVPELEGVGMTGYALGTHVRLGPIQGDTSEHDPDRGKSDYRDLHVGKC